MAAADAVQTVLGVEPANGKHPIISSQTIERILIALNTVSPLSITKANATAVQVVLDSRLVESTPKIAVHPSKSDVTVFISGTEIKTYLEGTGVKVTVVDFGLASVQAASKEVAKAPPVKVSTKKDSEIHGAELIGITTRKEADFSNWYQQVLTKGDMLDYYDISGCYILKVWPSIDFMMD
jgi:prolyl-tRNA synthetase